MCTENLSDAIATWLLQMDSEHFLVKHIHGSQILVDICRYEKNTKHGVLCQKTNMTDVMICLKQNKQRT